MQIYEKHMHSDIETVLLDLLLNLQL